MESHYVHLEASFSGLAVLGDKVKNGSAVDHLVEENLTSHGFFDKGLDIKRIIEAKNQCLNLRCHDRSCFVLLRLAAAVQDVRLLNFFHHKNHAPQLALQYFLV